MHNSHDEPAVTRVYCKAWYTDRQTSWPRSGWLGRVRGCPRQIQAPAPGCTLYSTMDTAQPRLHVHSMNVQLILQKENITMLLNVEC